jgi:ADP-ribose pyrophosphatase
MSGVGESEQQRPGRLATQRVYSGRVISVDLDTVCFPDGSTGDLEMVRHPGASAIVPFLDDPGSDDPRVLLLRQYRYAAQDYLYEIPAGRLEDGEAPLRCAVRELQEETGYSAAKLEPLLTMYTTPGFTDERIHVFLASDLTPGRTAPERDEFIEVIAFRMSEALRLINSGAIRDAKSALALLFAVTFRRGAVTFRRGKGKP